MGIKSTIHIQILNDTLDIVTLMTHGHNCTENKWPDYLHIS